MIPVSFFTIELSNNGGDSVDIPNSVIPVSFFTIELSNNGGDSVDIPNSDTYLYHSSQLS